jgi:aspartate aminotransferase
VFAGLGDELKITADIIEKHLTDKTKVIILNTPSNPTGMICDKEEIEKIAKLVVDNDLFVVSDEVYEHFIYDGKTHCCIASLNEDVKKKTLIVNAVSKTYSMTGWRIGYVVGDRDIIKAASALQSHSTSNPTSISQKAAVEALNGQQDTVKEMRDAFDVRRKFIVDELNSMDKVSCVVPEGAFYVFPDISATGLDSMMFASRLLDEAKVAVIPGIAFGSDKHIRISYATSMEEIKDGMERIRTWLDKI